MFNAPAPRSGNMTKAIALSIGLGLLVGAGIVTPIALGYRSSMQQAQSDARQAAASAETARQESISLEKQKSELRENLGQAEQAITVLKTDLSASAVALQTLKEADALKAREIDALKTDVQARTLAMADLTERLKAARIDVEGATQQNGELTARVNSLRTEISLMSEKVDVQSTEIARLVEVAKQQEVEKVAAQTEARQAQAQVAAANEEIMSLAPIRIEERHSTKTGRKLGEKSGVPFAAVFDPIGDAFTGIGEGLFGKSGPVVLVAVYKDGHEETLTAADTERWAQRGIAVVKLGQVRRG